MKKRYLAIALVILSFISLFIGVSNNCWYGTKYKWSYNAADK